MGPTAGWQPSPSFGSFMIRCVMPYIYLAAGFWRYNVFSLIYLILFLISAVVPKTVPSTPHRLSYVICCVGVFFSACDILGQLIYNLTLVGLKDYDGTVADGTELSDILRFVGFIKLNIPAGYVVQQVVPGPLVFIAGWLSLRGLHLKSEVSEEEEEEEDDVGNTLFDEDEDVQDDEPAHPRPLGALESRGSTSSVNMGRQKGHVAETKRVSVAPSAIRSKRRTSHLEKVSVRTPEQRAIANYVICGLLCLAGVAEPCVLSGVYQAGE
eukprot:Colp12_sorted_trinity150504_noHs@12426